MEKITKENFVFERKDVSKEEAKELGQYQVQLQDIASLQQLQEHAQRNARIPFYQSYL